MKIAHIENFSLKGAKMKKTSRLVATILRIGTHVMLAGIMLLVTGCPELSVTELTLVPGSNVEGKFTLRARAEARYEREVCEPEENGKLEGEDCVLGPELYSGNGLIGVWLPEGWEVDGARLIAASEDKPEALLPMEYLAEAFPPTFPYAPGKWWPFITECKEIRDGVTVYDIEFDVSGDASVETIGVGVALTYYKAKADEEGTIVEGPEMTAKINLTSGTIESREYKVQEVLPDPVQNEKVKWCVSVPQPVGRGPRGCSCNETGKENPRPGRLLSVLLGLVI